MNEPVYPLSVDQIMRYLPHRFPFVMIDRVLEIHAVGDVRDLSPNNKVGIRVVASKCVSFNEPHMQGHFPGMAIMPGVLMIESMAQTACFSLYPYVIHRLEEFVKGFQSILVGVDGVRFRRPVVPGDLVKMESVVTRCRGRIWAFHVEASVDGKKVAEADLMANMVTSDSFKMEG